MPPGSIGVMQNGSPFVREHGPYPVLFHTSFLYISAARKTGR